MVDVILDRDGTLIEEVPYLSRPQGVCPTAGAFTGLRRLASAGCRLFVASNQSGVARGFFGTSELALIDHKMDEVFAGCGITFAGKRYCLHAPEDGCPCRKPRPGLLLQLAQAYRIDLERAWMVGDKLSDIAAGRAVGCRTILVRTGCGAEAERAASGPAADAVLDDLGSLAGVILAGSLAAREGTVRNT